MHKTAQRRIGWLGLGAMGDPMARRLLERGALDAAFNRTPERSRPFAELGVAIADTPRRLATEVDTLFLMVSDDAALEAVLFDGEGVLSGLRAQATVVNMSTVSVAATGASQAAVEAAGGRFVDAPVSGTVGPAREGKLLVLASGTDAVLDEVGGLLAAFGEVLRLGEVGSGTRAKLFINLLLGRMMQAFAEAAVFGRALGLSLDTMLEIIGGGAMAAPLFRVKGEMIGRRQFDKQFPVDLLLKDLGLAQTEAANVGVYLPALAAVREAASGAKARGYGGQDMAALIRFLEDVSGVTVSAGG
ncbi:MAG TPA: NAD(P)-dependent oxidoreductase [Trueperaceae bacterium]|nr:NAD(P)-dependent oxidoreductase [Trueperaceae bacterium]